MVILRNYIEECHHLTETVERCVLNKGLLRVTQEIGKKTDQMIREISGRMSEQVGDVILPKQVYTPNQYTQRQNQRYANQKP